MTQPAHLMVTVSKGYWTIYIPDMIIDARGASITYGQLGGVVVSEILVCLVVHFKWAARSHTKHTLPIYRFPITHKTYPTDLSISDHTQNIPYRFIDFQSVTRLHIMYLP